MQITSKMEKEIQDFFLDFVCKNTLCGSQRCDGSSEWLEGCVLYQKFKVEILKTVENLLKG